MTNQFLNCCFTEDFFSKNGYITELPDNYIFVFGSNLAGQHAGGAAKAAVQYFGAVWGQGEGLQGQSYAIPTMQGGAETIQPYVDKFLLFACAHQELTFVVTAIGCGIARLPLADMAGLFKDGIGMKNVILPKSFFFSIFAEKYRDESAFVALHSGESILANELRDCDSILLTWNDCPFHRAFKKDGKIGLFYTDDPRFSFGVDNKVYVTSIGPLFGYDELLISQFNMELREYGAIGLSGYVALRCGKKWTVVSLEAGGGWPCYVCSGDSFEEVKKYVAGLSGLNYINWVDPFKFKNSLLKM